MRSSVNENNKSRLEELRQSRLIRGTTLYVIAGWLLIQFLDIALEAFGAPEWVMQWVLIGVLLGLPLTLVTEWLMRRGTYSAFQTGIAALLILGSLAGSVLVYINYSFDGDTSPSTEEPRGDIGGRRDKNPVLAVLPFNNMSPDIANEYLADGMTEDIITLLAQSPGLDVIARNSTFQYKNTSPDIREVGQKLGADYVIEGSIRPLGDRIRVTVQVIETSSGSHIWAQQYDRAMDEFFEVQDDISRGVAAISGDAVFRKEYKDIYQSRPDDLSAWQATLRAMMEFNRLSGDFNPAPLLTQAIEIDPDYALPYAVLSRSLALSGLYQKRDAQKLEEAARLARKALSLAPNDPRVLSYSAMSLMFSGEPEEALPLARRAVEISPSYAEGLAYYGDSLIHNGRPQEGIRYLEDAIRLTPHAPEAGMYYLMRGEAEIHMGRFEAAHATLLESNRLAPNPVSLFYQAGVELMLDRPDEAGSTLIRAKTVPGQVSREVSEQAASLEFYSTDDGGENFKAMWAKLGQLEQDLADDHQSQAK